MQSLKPRFNSVKEPTIKFLSNQEKRQLSPLKMREREEYGIFMFRSMHLTILQSFNIIGQEHNIFS